jgi:VanZ family protein
MVSEDMLSRILPNVTIHYGDVSIAAKHEPYEFTEFLFRKTAHFGVYMILGAVLFVAFQALRLSPFQKSSAVIVLIIVAAGLDEWNQTTRDYRTGTVQDVLIDLCGGILGLFLCYQFFKLKKAS